MHDLAYFALLGVTLVCAILSPFAAVGIIQGKRGLAAGIKLGVMAPLGVVCSLPFAKTQEAFWLPAVCLAYFAAVVLIAVLCALSAIRADLQEAKDR